MESQHLGSFAQINRRHFLGAGLTGLAITAFSRAATGDAESASSLPKVRWGRHDISRMLVGHNPIKGVSHTSEALSREMRDYFAQDMSRGVEMLRRCEETGINACQMGYRANERFIEEMLRRHYAAGGQLKWIASFYSHPAEVQAVRQELAQLQRMNPPPIGMQQVGNTTDLLMRQGRIDLALENLKRFRDTGLLVGLGSHNHEVIEYAESKGWDVDFYQCSFYRSVFSLNDAHYGRERFVESDRDAMTRTIRKAGKPCIAFKVLAAGRHCQSIAALEEALRYAFNQIKPNDVVLLGMWQKHRDQVGENVNIVRNILDQSVGRPLNSGSAGSVRGP